MTGSLRGAQAFWGSCVPISYQMMKRKAPPKILIFADWYLPGYKAGGQVTSVAYLIECLGDAFEFFVMTRDRDLTDDRAYSGVPCNEWVANGKARVLYSRDFSFRHLWRRIVEVTPDIVYLNSFFSTLTIKILSLRRCGLLGSPIVLAPRGEFSPGALNLKRWRKWLYRNIALRSGFYNDLVWHATSGLEHDQISAMVRKMRLKHLAIHEAEELPSVNWLRVSESEGKPVKQPGAARFLYLSRISKIKNLLFVLEIAANLNGRVEFDLYGPVDDRDYWAQCRKRIESLPGNVVVRHHGAIPRENVPRIAEGYHFFLLPTQGENFGWVIVEAMAAGCPVVISDQTPWRDLDRHGAGWCLPLDNAALWRAVLQQCVDMNQESYQAHSLQARQYLKNWIASNVPEKETAQLFSLALGKLA